MRNRKFQGLSMALTYWQALFDKHSHTDDNAFNIPSHVTFNALRHGRSASEEGRVFSAMSMNGYCWGQPLYCLQPRLVRGFCEDSIVCVGIWPWTSRQFMLAME